MNRYDIAMDFKKKFIEQNENVWRKTIKTSFIAINGNDVKVSSNPFSMENAEHGLVIFHYTSPLFLNLIVAWFLCSLTPMEKLRII